MLRALFMVFMVISSVNLYAQEVENKEEYQLPKHQIAVSYFGEYLTHPGFKVGYLTPISESSKIKNEKDLINKAWTVGGYFTYYKHKMNHDALMWTGEIGKQRINKNGLITMFNFEMGYMLSLLDGEVYTPTDDGGFEEGNRGDSYFVFGLNLGLGWDFEKKMDIPLSALVVPHFYIQAPYNTAVTGRVAVEVKFQYHLKSK